MTDGPSFGNRPSLESRPFRPLAHQFRCDSCSVHTRPTAAHIRPRGRCTMTKPCMGPFRGQPMQELPNLTVGLSRAQCREGGGVGGGTCAPRASHTAP